MAFTDMQPPSEQPAMNICLPLKPFTVQLSRDLQGKQALRLARI